ncbi:RNA polymerase sigma factor [Arthrobacter sp. GAS37]|uniref:RNA polymerase sigma factor n=1 Tax=Arthrobacter sp. GAS37 TaxID=3156261 RepID=UPI00384D51AF
MVQSDEESGLLAGLRAGDPEAMTVLYERYRGPGLQFAIGLMGGTQEAEDVLHDAFVKVVCALRNGNGPSDVFGAYLFTSIRSVANRYWKKLGNEQPTPDEDLDPIPFQDPGLESALSLFEQKDIAAAMRSLPDRWRLVLWYAEVLGEKPRDIAPVMEIRANAVSALLNRAKTGLRAAYEEQATAGPAASRRGE